MLYHDRSIPTRNTLSSQLSTSKGETSFSEQQEQLVKNSNNIVLQSVPSPSNIWETIATIVLGKSFDLNSYEDRHNDENNNNNNNNNNNTNRRESNSSSRSSRNHNNNSCRMTFEEAREYAQMVTVLRAGLPAFGLAIFSKWVYPSLSLLLASYINDSGVFTVISQDLSQYIQNILTTSGLVFALLVGQTYYFMYQQQESTFLALYEEVTMAKNHY
jgi:hypothetical protein